MIYKIVTWNGEGLPPVGTKCLYQGVNVDNDNRLVDGCEISILSEIVRKGNVGRVFTTTIGQDFILDYSCVLGTFKPLKTDVELAHAKLVDEMFSCGGARSRSLCSKLIEAGYRKHASLNRDFSTGDTDQTGPSNWTAGIDIPGHGNAIECHGGTKESAELIRDEILARLL